jgi:hypothetical protein
VATVVKFAFFETKQDSVDFDRGVTDGGKNNFPLDERPNISEKKRFFSGAKSSASGHTRQFQTDGFR